MRDKELKDFPDIQLLKELIRRNGFSDAPTKVTRQGEWSSVLLAVGKDETAEIILTGDALAYLGMRFRD